MQTKQQLLDTIARGEEAKKTLALLESRESEVVRTVKVDRTRTLQEAIAATARKQCVDDSVASAMPRGEGEEVEVVFFHLDLSERGGYISGDDLNKEYELRGLKPVDPYTLAAVNEADPAFADTHPNATHWKGASGNWCYAVFGCWCSERNMRVDRCVGGWDDIYWFAGVADD